MIHLDTNDPIRMLVNGSAEAGHMDSWLAAGESFAASAIAWTEFLDGPVTPVEIINAEALIQSRILSFGKAEATVASDLFNKTGRRRGSRLDCLIAAAAIVSQAQIATVNQADFKPFAAHGLALATPLPR
jgi:predicted nucleic acid-binding protein